MAKKKNIVVDWAAERLKRQRSEVVWYAQWIFDQTQGRYPNEHERSIGLILYPEALDEFQKLRRAAGYDDDAE